MKKNEKEKLNKYLKKEILKLDRLGIKHYEIDSQLYFSKSKTCFGYCKKIKVLNSTEDKKNDFLCKIYLSRISKKLKKKEIKSILMHEVLHTSFNSNGHDRVWKENCRLIKANYNYDGFEDYHLHEKPYSKNRAKKFKKSGYFK